MWIKTLEKALESSTKMLSPKIRDRKIIATRFQFALKRLVKKNNKIDIRYNKENEFTFYSNEMWTNHDLLSKL